MKMTLVKKEEYEHDDGNDASEAYDLKNDLCHVCGMRGNNGCATCRAKTRTDNVLLQMGRSSIEVPKCWVRRKKILKEDNADKNPYYIYQQANKQEDVLESTDLIMAKDYDEAMEKMSLKFPPPHPALTFLLKEGGQHNNREDAGIILLTVPDHNPTVPRAIFVDYVKKFSPVPMRSRMTNTQWKAHNTRHTWHNDENDMRFAGIYERSVNKTSGWGQDMFLVYNEKIAATQLKKIATNKNRRENPKPYVRQKRIYVDDYNRLYKGLNMFLHSFVGGYLFDPYPGKTTTYYFSMKILFMMDAVQAMFGQYSYRRVMAFQNFKKIWKTYHEFAIKDDGPQSAFKRLMENEYKKRNPVKKTMAMSNFKLKKGSVYYKKKRLTKEEKAADVDMVEHPYAGSGQEKRNTI